MKKILVLSATLLLFIDITFAQTPTGALTVFSEDGNKFFLILNGQRQNTVAQTNLRVDGLTQPHYSAKIIFEDQTLPQLEKGMLQVADYNNVMNDVTYKIKKDKEGKMNLKLFSFTPMQQNYVAPPDVVVMHYGTPADATSSATAGGTVTQTTTTTTTNIGQPTNVTMNVNGMNMGVNISDPNMTTGTVQTTTSQTTTTTSSSSNMGYQEMERPHTTEGCAGSFPMNPGDFASALNTIKNQGFDDTKLSTAKQIAGSNCLSPEQISEICKTFGFEDKKLDFAKFAYGHCTEPGKYFKINNVFGFSSSVDDLNKYIQNRQ